jgi:hypothetical protein
MVASNYVEIFWNFNLHLKMFLDKVYKEFALYTKSVKAPAAVLSLLCKRSARNVS